jgi:uncharacterized protein YraI
MADCYKVTAKKTRVRSGKGTKYSVVKTLQKGNEVRIYKKASGENNKQWGNTVENGNAWVPMTDITKTGNDNTTSKDRTTTTTSTTSTSYGTKKENTATAKDDTTYGNTDSSYNTVMLKYLRAFGSPPKFTKDVDPWYGVSNSVGVGRSMAMTWYSDPSILSLCPGTVDYLPGFNSKQKSQFFNRVKDSMSGDILKSAKKDKKTDLNGQLYAFKSAYTSYINVVNLLARISADFMGIGNVSNIISGTKIKLKNFDYGYYTNPSGSSSGGIFSKTLNSLKSAVTDGSYIHFFVNHSGVSVSETISTESGKSWLEEQLGSSGTLDSAARNIQFLFGGAITQEAQDDIANVLSKVDGDSMIGGFATIAANYLKGGRLVFPQMITGMNYDKSMSCELSFASMYGDRRSIFKYVILPCLHLLALATPKQLSSNMYTYPFLVRAFQRGSVNMDLAFMSNLEFTRGGSDNTSWTVDGLPTEVTARFTITPLYTNMMVTSAKNPFLAMQNTALMEYLGTMVGLDLKSNILDRKVEIAKNLLANRIHDIPTNLARGITDTKLVNEIRKFVSIVN